MLSVHDKILTERYLDDKRTEQFYKVVPFEGKIYIFFLQRHDAIAETSGLIENKQMKLY